MPNIQMTVKKHDDPLSPQNKIIFIIIHIYHSFPSNQLGQIIRYHLDHLHCSNLTSGELDKYISELK